MKKKHILVITAGIFLVWVLSGVFISTWFKDPQEPLNSGTFGDMFGAVNALFSGLAFAGLIYTISVQRQELQEQKKAINMQTDELKLQIDAIKMQTEELALQREAIQMQTEELKLQRDETARSADQLEIQRKLMNFQLALTTLNELIVLKNKKFSNFRFMTRSGESYEGMQALSALAKDHKNNNFPVSKDEPVLQDYYNFFFYIMQYIINSDLDSEQKKMLGNMLGIDTSDWEVYILYTAFTDDQYRLALLKQFEFQTRYQRMMKFFNTIN